MKKPAAKPKTARRRVADRQVAEFQRRDLGSDVPVTARVL